jgi:hypothetical protein
MERSLSGQVGLIKGGNIRYYYVKYSILRRYRPFIESVSTAKQYWIKAEVHSIST